MPGRRKPCELARQPHRTVGIGNPALVFSAPMTPAKVLALCREKEIKAVDLRFMDFPGTQKHFTIPLAVLTEESFEDGLGFNGSSIRGWKSINESDMLVVP